jgi:hypothetical protein
MSVVSADFKHAEVIGTVFGKPVSFTHNTKFAILELVLNQVYKIIVINRTETFGLGG